MMKIGAKKPLWAIAALGLCAAMMTGCTASADMREGQAEGYGGTLRVQVTMDGSEIAAVQILEQHETDGVGSRALEIMPDEMIRLNTWEVDGVSGATVTSTALREAVRLAMESPSQAGQTDAADLTMDGDGLRDGIGMMASGRVGPGKDDEGGQVYSFNVVFAHGQFDAQGRIVSMAIDQLEVTTPNYSGAGTPEFSGFPGQGGYSLWDDTAGKVVGHTEDSEDQFMKEISAWTSKRARGEDYQLTSGSWAEQMDAYEEMMVGKTVDEVEAWFTSRMASENSATENDTPESATMDETSSATISLRDEHGDILTAIRRAWENAQETK